MQIVFGIVGIVIGVLLNMYVLFPLYGKIDDYFYNRAQRKAGWMR